MRLRRFRPNLGMSRMMMGRFLGPELITAVGDRDFSAGAGNWTASTGEITWDNISMNFNYTVWGYARLAVQGTPGVLHRVGYETILDTSGLLAVRIGGVGDYTTISTTIGVHTINVVAEANGFIYFGSGNWIGSIDNINLKAVL